MVNEGLVIDFGQNILHPPLEQIQTFDLIEDIENIFNNSVTLCVH